MRNVFPILIAAALVSLFPSCQKEVAVETVVETDTVTVNLQRGLIAYYPFTGNANDSSGNNKHGMPMNGVAYASNAQGLANSAAEFDGIDDYINVTDANNYFAPPKLSVSFQVNLRNTAARNMFLCKSAFPTPSSVSWGVNLTNKIGFTVADPTASFTPCGLWNHLTAPAYDTYSVDSLRNNTWYHITVIYNLGVKMIYINGQLNSASVSNYSNLMQCSSSDFKIGGWWQNDVISIHGKMDELRLYNRILAENEIEELATQIR